MRYWRYWWLTNSKKLEGSDTRRPGRKIKRSSVRAFCIKPFGMTATHAGTKYKTFYYIGLYFAEIIAALPAWSGISQTQYFLPALS